MTASIEQPTIQKSREADPQASCGEEFIREHSSDAVLSGDQESGSEAREVMGGEEYVTRLLDDMLAQIDRNLELANQHLARA